MIGIEIFSGAGGMSAGAKNAGISVRMGVEIDRYAAETFAFNHPDAITINKDIRNIKSIDIKYNKERKILFGGPPCQGFSRSNHRTRTKDNPNNWLFEEFFRVTKIWRPHWLVLENVEGILGTEKGLFIEMIMDRLHNLGYKANFAVLNAKDFGVPQDRTRLFVVGSIDGVDFKFPSPTTPTPLTVKQAISDLAIIENGNKCCILPYRTKNMSNYAKRMRKNLTQCSNNLVSRNLDFVVERYKYVPQGGNWANIPSELMSTYSDVSRCHTGIYHRLNENKPSVVIGNFRKTMIIHPIFNRGLSVREAARLQSFPDDFVFKGFLGNQQQQVGNAVPPLLAKEVFSQIMNSK